MYIELNVRFVDKTSCCEYRSLRVIEHIGMLERDDKSIEDDEDEKGVSQRLREDKHKGLSLKSQTYRQRAD